MGGFHCTAQIPIRLRVRELHIRFYVYIDHTFSKWCLRIPPFAFVLPCHEHYYVVAFRVQKATRS